MSASNRNYDLITGFWNVQRIGSPERDRWFLADAKLKEWVGIHSNPPDIIFLAEVTQKGQDWADVVNTDEFYQARGYSAEFYLLENANGDGSPCSFMTLKRDARFSPEAGVEDFEFKLIGNSIKRPYLEASWTEYGKEISVSGCHIIAQGGDKSADEIFTITDDISSSPRNAALIGDMNYDFSKLQPDSAEGTALMEKNWFTVDPGIDKTFSNGNKLDYMLVNSSVKGAGDVPAPPHSSEDFGTIDHAPIAYGIEFGE